MYYSFINFRLIFTHDNIYYKEPSMLQTLSLISIYDLCVTLYSSHWHRPNQSSLCIISLKDVARNGLLIASPISDFVLDEILLWKSHSRKTNKRWHKFISIYITRYMHLCVIIWRRCYQARNVSGICLLGKWAVFAC